jgi:hypothetical protein
MCLMKPFFEHKKKCHGIPVDDYEKTNILVLIKLNVRLYNHCCEQGIFWVLMIEVGIATTNYTKDIQSSREVMCTKIYHERLIAP